MAADKGHARHCVLFAFQPKKRNSPLAKWFVVALACGDWYDLIRKNWHERFHEGTFNLRERQQCENEELQHRNSAQTEKGLQLGVAQQVVRVLYSYE
jgi:hypothetical protein